MVINKIISCRLFKPAGCAIDGQTSCEHSDEVLVKFRVGILADLLCMCLCTAEDVSIVALKGIPVSQYIRTYMHACAQQRKNGRGRRHCHTIMIMCVRNLPVQCHPLHRLQSVLSIFGLSTNLA